MKTEQVKFTFQGNLPVRSYSEFAQHRARRLSLCLVTQSQSDTHAQMLVTGQVDLVDAFEMAMSLGPPDCIVRHVWRVEKQAETGKLL
jgi:acylphosphatase